MVSLRTAPRGYWATLMHQIQLHLDAIRPVTVFHGKESGEGRRGEVLAVSLPLVVRESDVEGVVVPREGEDVDGLIPPFMGTSSRPKLQNKLSS
jgi:hypothetical protein